MLIVWWLFLLWVIVPNRDNCVKDAAQVEDVARTVANEQKYLSGDTTARHTIVRGAVIRGDTTRRRLAIVFTGDEYADGGEGIRQTLKKYRVPASFFLTGRFYRTPAFQSLIRQLRKDGHYLGPHSDNHLLYCDWSKRDSLLLNQTQFRTDLAQNYAAMKLYGISKAEARYFLPPYEWYNDTIASWTQKEGLQLICFTPGTLSHADYTTPDLKNYRSSRTILQSIYAYEQRQPSGLNGFILLLHVGSHPARTDKLYTHLEELIAYLQKKEYQLIRVDKLFQ